MPLTVSVDERRAIRDELLVDISRVGDIALALDRDDPEQARCLRYELEQDYRLLDDLGWAEEDPGEAFELTMPAGELSHALARLHGLALGSLRQHISAPEDPHIAARNALAANTYTRILGEIAAGATSKEDSL
jgi:hypothetical protein